MTVYNLSDMDLPKPLMSMLGTLLSQYNIKNWNIYCNNHQNTCVVIRFNDTDGCTQPVQYRRVSEKQHARSIARSDLFKQNRDQDQPLQKTTTSLKEDTQSHCIKEDSQSDGVKDNDDFLLSRKRKKISNSPESNRTNTDIFEKDNFIDTPEKLVMPFIDHSPASVVSSSSMLDHFINPISATVTCNIAKFDVSTQVEPDHRSTSTQVKVNQSNTSAQCVVLCKSKLSQTRLSKALEKSTQVDRSSVVCADFSAQSQPTCADVNVQVQLGTTQPIYDEHSELSDNDFDPFAPDTDEHSELSEDDFDPFAPDPPSPKPPDLSEPPDPS